MSLSLSQLQIGHDVTLKSGEILTTRRIYPSAGGGYSLVLTYPSGIELHGVWRKDGTQFDPECSIVKIESLEQTPY